MPYTIRRWSDYDIAKLKSMAQKYPTAAIAAQLGRSPAATIVKAHELNLSLESAPKSAHLSLTRVHPELSCHRIDQLAAPLLVNWTPHPNALGQLLLQRWGLMRCWRGKARNRTVRLLCLGRLFA
jgi:hypothetical protein